jgi:hypothetical protein
VKVIHPTDLAEIQTVKAQWHLPMIPSCRTRESAVATNKFKEGHGSYPARLQQICFTMIRVRLLWMAMLTMNRPKFKLQKCLIEAALGAKFEIRFHNMLPHIKSFVFFCNLVDILHTGPAAAATKIKIQILGFLSHHREIIPPIGIQFGKIQFSDGARKTAVFSRVCFSFQRMGAV